jgi:hypothetical protein
VTRDDVETAVTAGLVAALVLLVGQTAAPPEGTLDEARIKDVVEVGRMTVGFLLVFAGVAFGGGALLGGQESLERRPRRFALRLVATGVTVWWGAAMYAGGAVLTWTARLTGGAAALAVGSFLLVGLLGDRLSSG